MLFNTIDFVVFFILVLVTIVIFRETRKFQYLFLLAASYFFFYYSSNYLISLLIFSTILDYYVGRKISESSSISHRKFLLIISLAGNLGLLGFFKYADFAILQFNILGNLINFSSEIPFLNLALPIGISFYTFQTISYTVDIYRKKLEPCKSLGEFALFVSFFPQLVAGPIVRASHFLPQLREKIADNVSGYRLKQIVFNPQNLKFGISLMALGFLKKMFFADNIAPLVDEIFANPIGLESLTVMLGAVAFGIQIYCDFSGYSDIAIGAAAILGFKIPINFNKPYFASSPSDFWRRWHISLSTWLRDYLYIPLGGNKKSKERTYVNLLIVMFLGGLWHGAAINFIIWGLLHGTYLAIHRFLSNRIKIDKNSILKTRVGKIISITITQYFVFLAWIAFRVHDTEHMFYAIQKYLIFDFQFISSFDLIMHNRFEVGLIGLFLILHFTSYKQQNLQEVISKLRFSYWILFLIIIMSLIFFFFEGKPEDFIYFQF